MVPKSMARRLGQRHRFDGRHHRVRFDRSRLQQRERNLLRQCRSAQTKNYQQNSCFRFRNRAQPGCQHDVSECPTWPPVLVLTQCRAPENGPSVLLNSRWSQRRLLKLSGQDCYDTTAGRPLSSPRNGIGKGLGRSPLDRQPFVDLHIQLQRMKNDEATEL
jgi:hypothetical protein